MSLLCAYSDSSSASGSDDEDAPMTARAPQQTTGLPSAAELFASGGSSAPGVAAFQSTSYDTSAPKRSLPHDQALSTAAATAAKRFKPDAQASAPGPPRSVKKATHFAPPQLKRPNVSTEDLGAWNTQKTIALQRKAKSAPLSSTVAPS